MQIPLELWFEILAEVGSDTTDRLSLSSCAQVCSLWRDHSQSLLFGSIDLISKAIGTFHCLIECIGTASERSRILKNYIQVLKVHICTTTSPQIGIRQEEFAQLLSHCPSLRSLTLRCDIPKLTPPIMDHVRTLITEKDGPRISELNIVKTPLRSSLLYQLVSLWPGIQSLGIACKTYATPPKMPSELRLRRLEISYCELLPSEVRDWLLSGSRDSMRILELEGEPGQGALDLVTKFGDSIQALRIPCFNKTSARVVERCKNLERLALILHHRSSLFHMRFPPFITQIAFYNQTGQPLQKNIYQTIRILPSVRIVILDGKAPEEPLFLVLKKECDERAISLVIDNRTLGA